MRPKSRTHGGFVRGLGDSSAFLSLSLSLARNYISCTRDKGHHTRQTRSIFQSTRYIFYFFIT